MRGIWLVRIGQWIARKETFERMVAPAIADMQIEASYGRLHRGKHYFAFSLVLVHAILQDLRLDLAWAFDAEARTVAWRRAAIWYAGFVVLLTSLNLMVNFPTNLTLDGVWSAALTSTVLNGIVRGVSWGVTVAVFYLYRRAYSRRSIVSAVLIVLTLTIAFASAVRPIKMSADRTLYNSFQARLASAPGANWRAGDLDAKITWWEDIQNGVSVIPFAIIGVVLARRKGWRIALTAAALNINLALVTYVLLTRFLPLTRTIQGWWLIMLNLVVAVVWLTFDKLLRRERQLASC